MRNIHWAKKFLKTYMPESFNNLLRLAYYEVNKRKTIKDVERIIDDEYYMNNSQHINWDDPISYTEKMNYSKLYLANYEKTMLTDKLFVRDWVKERIGEEYLIPLCGVYNSFNEIDFKVLPEKVVIKCNHDSGSAKILERCDLSEKKMKRLAKQYDGFYLKRNYAYKFFEMHYCGIAPKILIEQYLGDVCDYKFLCFNGIPYYCWIDIDRFSDHKRNIYNLNWELQPFTQEFKNYNGIVEKPQKFDEMVELVQKLSKGFDHVRVDLYNHEGDIYFGEMTFTNGSGLEAIKPKEWDYELGRLWDLDISKRDLSKNKLTDFGRV